MKIIINLLLIFVIFSCEKENTTNHSGQLSKFYSYKDNCFVKFSYNADNNVTRMDLYNGDILVSYYNLVYNDLKELIKLEQYDYNGILKSYNVYSYNEDTTIDSYYYLNNDKYDLVEKQLIINSMEKQIYGILHIDLVSNQPNKFYKYIWEEQNLTRIEIYDNEKDTLISGMVQFKYDTKTNPLAKLSIKSCVESLNTAFNFSKNNPVEKTSISRNIAYQYEYNELGLPMRGKVTLKDDIDTISRDLYFDYY